MTDTHTYTCTDTAWWHRPRLHSITRQKVEMSPKFMWDFTEKYSNFNETWNTMHLDWDETFHSKNQDNPSIQVSCVSASAHKLYCNYFQMQHSNKPGSLLMLLYLSITFWRASSTVAGFGFSGFSKSGSFSITSSFPRCSCKNKKNSWSTT